LRNGCIVETGESRALFENPRDQYTRELVEAVPHIDRGRTNAAVESQST
jgi:peptide/nickel transport system ATP-binding protein